MSEYIADLYVKSREMADQLQILTQLLEQRDRELEETQAEIVELRSADGRTQA